MTAQVATDLRAAADVLREYGWQQNRYGTSECGFCTIGAIDRIAVRENMDRDRESAVYDQLAQVTGTLKIVQWNDQRGRTADEVIAALEAAADAAEQQAPQSATQP